MRERETPGSDVHPHYLIPADVGVWRGIKKPSRVSIEPAAEQTEQQTFYRVGVGNNKTRTRRNEATADN